MFNPGQWVRSFLNGLKAQKKPPQSLVIKLHVEDGGAKRCLKCGGIVITGQPELFTQCESCGGPLVSEQEYNEQQKAVGQ